MGFYGYKGSYPLGKEPLGSTNKFIRRDLKTIKGAKRAITKIFGEDHRLFTYTNFFDDSTFIEIT